jgi:glycosyltransferase involved in cell wall biosynthesis
VVIHSGVLAHGSNSINGVVGDKPYILFVGTLEPRKNLRRLLSAFSQLVSENRIEKNLVIIGNKGWGEMTSHLLSRRSKSRGPLILKGYVDDSQLQHLYCSARCRVLPPLFEGFGLAVLEAMKFGVPAIVSDAGSLSEVTGTAGLIVGPRSKNSIARAIELLMKNVELHARLSEEARNRSTEFSWQKAERKKLTLFKSLAT